MSPHSIFCIADTPIHACRIVDRLKTASIPEDSISALLTDPKMSWPFGARKLDGLEGAVSGGGTGIIIGAAWGWIAGVGALAIPGVGLFIAAGPVIAAISGASLGAAFGSICGGLIGMGVPEIKAKGYEEKILKGDILLSVHPRASEDIPRVKTIFDFSKAGDIWASDTPRHGNS